MEVYVKIFANHMEVEAGMQKVTVTPPQPYAGRRILIGTFQPAIDCLQKALRELGVLGPLKKKPTLVIQSMEMNEGGLSEVEQQCLQEVGLAAGARKVEVR